VVLLHGQTMLSDPLPVAVTHRLQSFGAAASYALCAPNPGHRACFGLIATLRQAVPAVAVGIDLARFLEARFDRRIVQCRGAACEDKAACCNRSSLTCRDADGRRLVAFTVGGCSAVNELRRRSRARRGRAGTRHLQGAVDFVDGRQPRSDRPTGWSSRAASRCRSGVPPRPPVRAVGHPGVRRQRARVGPCRGAAVVPHRTPARRTSARWVSSAAWPGSRTA